MTVTITVEANHDLVDFGVQDYEEEIKNAISDEFGDIGDALLTTQILPNEPETIMKAEVKASIGVDGGLLTAVLSLELAGGALFTYCIYQCMKKVGEWLTNGSGQAQYGNMERSNVPLHENAAANPEETVRPNNRDDDSIDDYRTAILDSTRVDQTQVTNLTSFSPIGRPQMNRTQSYYEAPSNAGPSGLARSPSEPIRLDLDQNFDDSVADLNATALLSQPVPPSANSILQTAEAASANVITTANEAATANDLATANEAATANDPATANEAASANDAATVNDADSTDGDSGAERRYPQRIRSAPNRYGL